MKKILYSTLVFCSALFGFFSFSNYSFAIGTYSVPDPATTSSGGLTVNEGMVKGIGVAGAKQGQDTKDDLIKVVKNFINWVLGILSLITLVLLLWGGFQMVTAAGDDNKHKAGFKILKQAAIGLGFIALSWFIVSIIFWVIAGAGAGAGTTNS